MGICVFSIKEQHIIILPLHFPFVKIKCYKASGDILQYFKKRFSVIRLRFITLPVLIIIWSTALVLPSIGGKPIDPYPNFYAEERAQTEANTAEYEKCVYLSFDDGPSACTDDILDILAEKNVPATFFVIGPEGELTDERLLRIIKEGHEIGLHSFCHKYDEIYASVDSFLADLSKEQEWIYSVTGERCSVFRFPGGSANYHADKATVSAIKEEMSRRGFVWYDWNADGEDSIHKYISSWEISQNVFRCAKEKDSVVVLLHDASGHKATVEALPDIIDGFIERGYSFRLLSEMEKPMQYK